MSEVTRLKPANRYIKIVPHLKEETTENGVILPEDYKQEEKRYVKATVVDVSSDCGADFRKLRYGGGNESAEIVVDRSMIEEVDIDGKVHYMILENYVIGIFRRP